MSDFESSVQDGRQVRVLMMADILKTADDLNRMEDDAVSDEELKNWILATRRSEEATHRAEEMLLVAQREKQTAAEAWKLVRDRARAKIQRMLMAEDLANEKPR